MTIEEEAGIDSDEVAYYIMASPSREAKDAYNLLLLINYKYDTAIMNNLKNTVLRCKRNMKND